MQAVKIPFLAHPWHKFPEQGASTEPAYGPFKEWAQSQANYSFFTPTSANPPALTCLLNLNSKVHQRRSIHAHAHKVEGKWEKLAPCSSSLFLQSSARISNIIKTIMQMRLNFFWRIFSLLGEMWCARADRVLEESMRRDSRRKSPGWYRIHTSTQTRMEEDGNMKHEHVGGWRPLFPPQVETF